MELFASCKEKEEYQCPVDSCESGICKKCFKKLPSEKVTYIGADVNEETRQESDSIESQSQKSSEVLCDSDESIHQSIQSENSYFDDDEESIKSETQGVLESGCKEEYLCSEELRLECSESDDSTCVSFEGAEAKQPFYDLPTGCNGIDIGIGDGAPGYEDGDEEMMHDNAICPTTHVGEKEPVVVGKGYGFGTSVLFNKVGSVLVRQNCRLECSRQQKNIIQRVVAQVVFM